MIFVDRIKVSTRTYEPEGAFVFSWDDESQAPYVPSIIRYVAHDTPYTKDGYPKISESLAGFVGRCPRDRDLFDVLQKIFRQGAFLNGTFLTGETWRRLVRRK